MAEETALSAISEGGEKHFDAGRSPGGNSASEKICVFRPDGTADGQRGSQNRPVFRIPSTQPVPGLSFELTVDFASNQFNQMG